MNIDPKQLRSLLSIDPILLTHLRKLVLKKEMHVLSHPIPDVEGLVPYVALRLRQYGYARHKKMKANPPCNFLVPTPKGKKVLEIVDLLKKADKIEIKFKPCKGCGRTNGTHTAMCPVSCGIMRSR